MSRELAKGYEPHDVEKRWYAEWEGKGYFRAAATEAGHLAIGHGPLSGE